MGPFDMKINKVAIIGAGLMGSGIAQVIANAGVPVVLRSRRGPRGLEKLHKMIQKVRNRGILTDEQATVLLSNISCTSSLSEAVKEADLVIEAVPEDLQIKLALFRELDTYCRQNTILASNTSSLGIAQIAETTKRADKIIGMHFFNPAPVMKLVEIVKTPMTSKETINSIADFAIKIDKVPLIVSDSPGFVVNRILLPMINAAAYVLMEKIASAETIDSAMKLGANHPIGPLALADLVGIDVCLGILKELTEKFELKYPICPLFEQMVAEGRLGRKTGKGFFTYNEL